MRRPGVHDRFGGWCRIAKAVFAPDPSPTRKRADLCSLQEPIQTMNAPRIRSTTILAVRRDGMTAIGGDGQVTLGDTAVKHDTNKPELTLNA